MPSIKTIGLIGIPLAFAVNQYYIQPRVQLLGVGKGEVPGYKNDKCTTIPELQGCEDAWVDPPTNLAYLVCTPISQRVAWLPAIGHLNATELPASSGDYIALLDLKTNSHSKLRLTEMPQYARDNFHLHAIDAFHAPDDREHITIIVNSHNPQKNRADSPKLGANSVFEIFETRLGSPDLKWVKTVEHPLIRTPNNLVAMGPRQFYFTNDHRRKVHWSRKYSLYYTEPSDLIYCDASGPGAPHCIVAADDVLHPNGMARGPKDLLYSVSSGEGKLSIWEIQSGDHSLIPVDSVKLPHASDNVHVAPDGSIFIASFPRVMPIYAHFQSGGVLKSPVEVYRVRNDTSDAQFYGNKYKVEKVFGDNGDRVSASTSAAPWGSKLILTGVMSDKVAICDIA